MKTPKGLIVYLDTSDFVRLYKENLPNDLQSVKDFLLDKVVGEEIIIPNTYPLMVEFIQDFSEEHRGDRLRRAQLMKRLCGDYAFQYIPESDTSHCLNDRGVWTPSLQTNIGSIIRGMSQGLKNNPQTAKYAKDLLHPGKRIRLAQTHAELFSTSFATTDERESLLVRKLAEGDYVRSFLLKKMTKKEINREIEAIINDPESYVKRVHSYDPVLTKGMENMHNLASAIEFCIEKLKKDLEPYEKKLAELNEIKKQLLNSGLSPSDKKKVKQIHRDFAATFDTKNASKKYFTRIMNYFPPYFFDVFDAYFHTQLGPSPRTWKKSDIGDICHAFFIPHSDLWRGDRAFCNILIENDVRFSDRIVPKLLDLPNRIEELIKS